MEEKAVMLEGWIVDKKAEHEWMAREMDTFLEEVNAEEVYGRLLSVAQDGTWLVFDEISGMDEDAFNRLRDRQREAQAKWMAQMRAEYLKMFPQADPDSET